MIVPHDIILISLACIFGLFMTWSVGANDLANIMSTSIGSKSISVKQAVIIAIIFEIAGAMLGGHSVARTIQHGIINTQILNYPPDIFIYGMLAVLLASATWMTLASRLGMPVSITNAIVGSIVGLGVISLGIHAIYWKNVGYIALSWVISPTVAAIIAYLLFLSIQRFILMAVNPVKRAHKYLPIYLFLVGFVLSEITVVKVLEHLRINLDLRNNVLVAIISGMVIVLIGQFLLKKVPYKKDFDRKQQYEYIEKLFGILMLFTACAMAYAHGSNDIAISVGPIAAILSLVKSGSTGTNGPLITVILAIGSFTVIIGFLSYGRRIIATVGSGITALTPSRAYCATIAAATTVVISTGVGIPVSATQTLVGAILGVGLARGIWALDLRIIRNIFASWIITIPIAALLTALFFDIIKYIFI